MTTEAARVAKSVEHKTFIITERFTSGETGRTCDSVQGYDITHPCGTVWHHTSKRSFRAKRDAVAQIDKWYEDAHKPPSLEAPYPEYWLWLLKIWPDQSCLKDALAAYEVQVAEKTRQADDELRKLQLRHKLGDAAPSLRDCLKKLIDRYEHGLDIEAETKEANELLASLADCEEIK